MNGKRTALGVTTVMAATMGIALPATSFADVLNMSGGNDSLQFVTVGNPGNPTDPAENTYTHHADYGSVATTYRIAATEVTNAQYAEFLNSVAASDTHFLYDTEMGSSDRGGIIQAGSDGSYTYAVKSNMANKPVNHVTFYDAMRFVNWLSNGQGNGATESGVYTMTSTNGVSGGRATGAKYFLPTENEWYKAAYYQPAADGGDTDSYWRYATASNTTPTAATAGTTGDISNAGTNMINYNNGADWNGQDGNVTTVATAGNTSYYGTYDQSGNVEEWVENHVLRGGSYNQSSTFAGSTYAVTYFTPSNDYDYVGFRIAAAPIPEPASLALLGLGGLLVWPRRKRQSM